MNEIDHTIGKGGLLDDLEVALAKLPQVELPVVHRFTPGMYIREITIPANTMLTSMTHKTEHPFIISQGIIKVTCDQDGSKTLKAPYTGITKAGTRRALHAITDTIWTTFHATDETDVEKIGETILEPYDNPRLPDHTPQWLNSVPKTLPE